MKQKMTEFKWVKDKPRAVYGDFNILLLVFERKKCSQKNKKKIVSV